MSGSWSPTEFPRLVSSDFEITSPPTQNYNCLGWAAGEMDWWEPDPDNTYYWPPGAPREYTMAAFIAAYRSIGYQPCGTALLEVGSEKLALYADSDGAPTHAARQLPCGQWTSKLGPYEDIEHLTLECLNGDLYGQPVFYLIRRLQQSE
jgi:hypothetical protein